jgi:DNA replication protein DnaC
LPEKWVPTDECIRRAQDELSKHGYGPNPYCQVCRGGGWIYQDVPVGHGDYGRAFYCPGAGCRRESYEKYRQSKDYLMKIGVGPRIRGFDSFREVKGTEAALAAFRALAEGTTDRPFLLCYGGVGNGKTHLAEALTIRLHWRGFPVRMWAAGDLFRHLRQLIGANELDAELERINRLDALIIDDVGVQYGSDWELAKLEELVGYRYENMLITVLTMNKDITWLKAQSERIWSRFSDVDRSVLVLNNAPDYRRRGDKEG